MKIKTILIVKLYILIGITFFIISSQSADIPVQLTSSVKNLKYWIVESEDNQHLPFIIVDKKKFTVYVFEQDGKIIAATSSLIGRTIGDDNAPGIGQKRLADITINERTTPAGRFEGSLGLNEEGKEILWIDYDLDLSLHSVVTTNPAEHRLQRLASSHQADHRITYGCINVPKQFYKEHIQLRFKHTKVIVYILPEVHSVQEIFGSDAAKYSN